MGSEMCIRDRLQGAAEIEERDEQFSNAYNLADRDKNIRLLEAILQEGRLLESEAKKLEQR